MAFQPKEYRCGANRRVWLDTMPSDLSEELVTVTAQEGEGAPRTLFGRRIAGPLLPLLDEDAQEAIGDCFLCVGNTERKCTFQFGIHEIATGWLRKRGIAPQTADNS